jgi:hypothetical protein
VLVRVMSVDAWSTSASGMLRIPASEAGSWQRFGERRWAESWATECGEVAAGVELLDRFEQWDGPATVEVLAEFDALDKRLMAYDAWCDGHGLEPLRRPRPIGWSV